MVWPVLVLIGFLVLMALVVALGTRSTRLYETERQASPIAAGTAGGAEHTDGTVITACRKEW